MTSFEFKTDDKSLKYCVAVMQYMMHEFSISQEEAVGRINKQWSRLGEILGENNPIYHESPNDWARIIYFGANTKWWIDSANLEPQPYP